MNNILEIKDLYIEYHTLDGVAKAVNGLNLNVAVKEAVGLVGETGAGKTTTALSILGLLPKRTAKITKGNIVYEGIELLKKENASKLSKMRGDKISMVFQNPLTSLNPVFTIGEQIEMVYRLHRGMNKKEALNAAGEILETVGIPARRLGDYPNQFSGGMRQRVGIAAALACNPDLLIADEPTTALDVTIQAQVLELMKKMQAERNTSLIMITHNLGIVNELCEKVAVMYAGRIVEYGPVREVFRNPQHPYTLGLINSLPDINKKIERLTPIEGYMSNPMNLPKGCKFGVRCPHCCPECLERDPDMLEVSEGHVVACIVAKNGRK